MSRLAPLTKKIKLSLRSRWQTEIGDHVIAVAWSPREGQPIAAAAVDGPITLFDRKTGAVLHTLRGHGFGTTAISWHPDGKLLASAGQDGKVRLWNTDSGEQVTEMAGGAAWVEQVAWCPVKGGKRAPLLASAAGKVLRFWDAAGQLQQEYTDHASTIADIQWHAGRNELAVVPYGGVWLYNLAEPAANRHFAWKGASLKLAWSPDGKYLATGDQDATVHFWITRTGEDLQMWGYPTKVRELAWNTTGRYLATGGGPTVTVWDCAGKGPEGSKPLQLEGHQDLLSGLAFQHKGALLASTGNDGHVMLWAPGLEKKSLVEVNYATPVTQLAWSPDDHFLVVGTDGGVVESWAIAA